MAQLRQRSAADDPQHFVVAPFALRSTRPEFAFDQPPALDESFEGLCDRCDADPVTPRNIDRCKRTMRACESQNEISERIGDRLKKTLGNSLRQRDADRIAIPAGILCGDPPPFIGDGDFDDAALFRELGDPLTRAARTLSLGRGPA